ncbi:DUF3189 family protein [Thermovenabulum gondwanense]|uniref:DUF3189 domain-containing protein n=1 Tax=Thermovenabulum gondwanense TaxID=520767 RepID=A0A162MMC5_9FIRM|nr:DUF3189 family protein [Thermovenabulum gondwanense]KYO66703.1 hypothetical protein ATZ99_09470 [Thermovenabulum gondwanense]
MKIFYYCYGSAHSSVVAAAIHTGYLPMDRIPEYKEFIKLPYYDKTKNNEIGTPFFMGKDEFENEIFIIGMTNERELIKKIIISYLKECGIDHNQIYMVGTLQLVNLKTKIGGILSRRLGLVFPGRPLTIKGIQERYFDFVDLVKEVKKKFNEINFLT